MTEWPGAAFYRGRRVLITGGNGFLGLNLGAALAELGANVTVLSRSTLPRDDISLPLVGRAREGVIRQVTGDLRDATAVRDALDESTLVFNLAAHSGSTSSNLEPFEDLDVNLRGHLTLLEACRRLESPPRIVFPSSRLVYRPAPKLPVPESAPTGPLSLYGVHKLAAEHYHLLYRHLYGLSVVILRITNAYGPSQRPAQNRYGIINWFIHLAVSGDVLPIYGDGHQLRDYVHADDVTRALLLAGASQRADGEIFNLGSGQGVAFEQMAETVVEAAGSGRIEHRPWPPDAERVETGDFVADITKIGRLLGWQPSTPLERGLGEVVGQYRQMESIR